MQTLQTLLGETWEVGERVLQAAREQGTGEPQQRTVLSKGKALLSRCLEQGLLRPSLEFRSGKG